jgi:hypothetical protein
MKNDLIWVSWSLNEDGQVVVLATYSEGSGFVRKEQSYASLEDASGELGPGFKEVVERSTQAGSFRGRWRP